MALWTRLLLQDGCGNHFGATEGRLSSQQSCRPLFVASCRKHTQGSIVYASCFWSSVCSSVRVGRSKLHRLSIRTNLIPITSGCGSGYQILRTLSFVMPTSFQPWLTWLRPTFQKIGALAHRFCVTVRCCHWKQLLEACQTKQFCGLFGILWKAEWNHLNLWTKPWISWKQIKLILKKIQLSLSCNIFWTCTPKSLHVAMWTNGVNLQQNGTYHVEALQSWKKLVQPNLWNL